jgi:hypothetical protein
MTTMTEKMMILLVRSEQLLEHWQELKIRQVFWTYKTQKQRENQENLLFECNLAVRTIVIILLFRALKDEMESKEAYEYGLLF